MTYTECLDFLYSQLPQFQRDGQSAYKPGLDTARTLAAAFGNPHKKLRCIHIAGTNGKGSTAHTIAAILQNAGYRTGLFTSPHLVDFRERMRINGQVIPEENVASFVDRFMQLHLNCSPSFFELTTIMAFEWFAAEDVDFAIIETGLGGRLDTTNIITPLLSVITNISLDHTALLGRTLPEIAAEKAGIIKPGVPIVVGEYDEATAPVFIEKATEEKAPIVFAHDICCDMVANRNSDGEWVYSKTPFGEIRGELSGDCQAANAFTIMAAVVELRKAGIEIPDDAVANGFLNVVESTGLSGRWMKIDAPVNTICDTGHNVGGWQYISRQLSAHDGRKHIIVGFVNDKDVSAILRMIADIAEPKTIYFTQASVPRALPAQELADIAREHGLNGSVSDDVNSAYQSALANAAPDDLIFVGGSTFVVADFLAAQKNKR